MAVVHKYGYDETRARLIHPSLEKIYASRASVNKFGQGTSLVISLNTFVQIIKFFNFIEDFGVIILDEVTSNIDKDAQQEIFSTLLEEYKGKIVFIISHDLTNEAYCNKVIAVTSGSM